MKKPLLIISLLLLCAVAIKMGGDFFENKQTNQDISDSTSKNNTKKRSANRLNSNLPETVESDTASEFILDILDVNRPVLQRAPEIMRLRQKHLNSADEKALLAHLEKIHTNESQAIKNDIIEHMVRFGKDQKQVGQTLLNILNDSNQDKVVREYTLQYIPEYYLKRWDPSSDWDLAENEDRLLFNNTLWSMTDLTEGSMAGGALFALFRLADKYEDLNTEDVFKKSLEVMVDSSYMNPNRMGAVQILAFSQNEKYFQEARKIVLDEGQPLLLKVTAIHTATRSKFQDKEFNDYLQTLAKGGDGVHPTLSKCARLTLSKIK